MANDSGMKFPSPKLHLRQMSIHLLSTIYLVLIFFTRIEESLHFIFSWRGERRKAKASAPADDIVVAQATCCQSTSAGNETMPGWRHISGMLSVSRWPLRGATAFLCIPVTRASGHVTVLPLTTVCCRWAQSVTCSRPDIHHLVFYTAWVLAK